MAITNEATIRVKIDGKDAEVSVKELGKAIETSMKRGKVEADKLKSSFTKIGDAAQRFYFSIQSLRMFVQGAANFVRAANQQEVAVAGFEQAMKSMGRYTGEFSKQLQGLATQIQSEGIIGDEAILEGTKFLATYKDISNETLPQAMRVMTDIAALMGGDVRNAANMVGKASMGMTGELRRAGITISDATMKSKDFNAILREIEEQVGGQNKALAATSAGGMKQFANAWGDLKEVIGTVMKQFIIPFIKMLRPMMDTIKGMDTSLLGMVAALGLTGIALMKLIPIIRTLGVTSKLALGWIGIIITALTLLYTAWTTNFGGIRDALTGFWEFLKGWSNQIGTTLSALGKIIVGVLTFSGTKIKEGWNELKDSFVDTWKAAFEKVKKDGEETIPPAKGKIQPAFEAAGVAAGESFAEGLKKGLEVKLPNKFSDWAKLAKGKAAPELEKNPLADLPEAKKSVFWDYIDMFSEMGDMAKNTFDTIGNSMQMLSDRLTQALFNTKTKFKDLWVAMAMDFTRIFVNYVISQLAQFLAFKVFGNLLNIAVPGAGTIINAVTPITGGGSIAGVSNLENQLVALNRNVQRISPIVNNNISGRQLYNAVKWEREKDLIRRGQDVNNSLF